MFVKTRLEILCDLHGQQGGTIFEFNRLYGVDFITMDEDEFIDYVVALRDNTEEVA